MAQVKWFEGISFLQTPGSVMNTLDNPLAPCTVDPGIFFYDDFELEDSCNDKTLTLAERRALGRWREEQHEQELRAKLICSTCPMQQECLELGLAEEYGVWGGYNPQERARLREGKPLTVAKDRHYSPHRRAEVVDLFLQGMSVSSIRMMLGTSRQTVIQHLVNEVSIRRDGSLSQALAS